MVKPFLSPPEDDPITETKARELADLSASMPFHTLGKGPTQAAPGNHKHAVPTFVGLGVFNGGVANIGSIPANSSAGPFTIPHGLSKEPVSATVTPYLDATTQSFSVSIESWSKTELIIRVRNLTGSAKAANISWIAVG